MGAEQDESDASMLGDRTCSTLQSADRAVLQGKKQQDRLILNQCVPKTGAAVSECTLGRSLCRQRGGRGEMEGQW